MAFWEADHLGYLRVPTTIGNWNHIYQTEFIQTPTHWTSFHILNRAASGSDMTKHIEGYTAQQGKIQSSQFELV